VLDAVLAALVERHPQRAVERVLAGGLLHQVEVLPAHQLGEHAVVDGLCGGQRVGRQAAGAPHLAGPHEHQVAEEDGRTLPELGGRSVPAGVFVHRLEAPVRGRSTPAQVAGVHHVVVDQGAGLEQLQRCGGGANLRDVAAARASPAPVAERRAEPLAAGQQVFRCGQHWAEGRVGEHVTVPGAASVDE
jgi:hypothetical protein